MEATTSLAILDARQIDQKIKRMAYEIYENNFTEKKIIFAGICKQGEGLANKLAKELKAISEITTSVIRIDLDKTHPFRTELNGANIGEDSKNKVVILVDDVLNTGKTIAYGLKPFLSVQVKKIEVAVLVNRAHPAFPICPTYTGYELSTTLSEQVVVKLKGKDKGVYLN
jgi:pyrimidine operon attenuation protein/uracil phosphoribosyltransferase